MAEAAVPYAEVVGDPVAHSLSPAIHLHWLRETGIAGDYRATRCRAGGLKALVLERRQDPFWRGCNVTMPLKEEALAACDSVEPAAFQTAAVNCIVSDGRVTDGSNTDLDGIAFALGEAPLEGKRAVVIGGGGAARAALAELTRRGASPCVLLRDPAKVAPLRDIAPDLEVLPFAEAKAAFSGAAAIINATPLGMRDMAPMPGDALEALRLAPGALALDMVYDPIDTAFLQAARIAGLAPVDGLTMLIGQARRAFHLFFGTEPPPGDDVLRTRLRAG